MRLISTSVIVLLSVTFPASADMTLWYNGDTTSPSVGTVNESSTNNGIYNTFDNFQVTAASGWNLDRLWSNDSFTQSIANVTQASWSIRTGMAPGNGGTVVFSGTSTATLTATGRSVNNGLEYSVQVSGLNINLAAGTYWLSVTPLVGADVLGTGYFNSYNSYTNGLNAVGTPPGNDNNGLLSDAPSGSAPSYLGFNANYSMGVAGSVAPSASVPEPASLILMGSGLTMAGLAVRRGRRAAL